MEDSPVTRASLLLRIRDGQDKEAWRQFVEIYASLIYGFARKRGLQDADAADLMQDVLRSVASAVGRLDYDPRRGSFRSWLYTVTRNKLYSFLDGQRRHPRGSGDSRAQQLLEEQVGPDDSAAAWDQEYQRRLFAWAAERVRGEFQESTWQAFWQTAVEGRGPKDVARELNLSPGAVYVAKSRVIARLREKIQEVQDEE
ncbi:MAG TPA: sigma-70 family RNA polymerase sigma factor [Gemmataceae bacterium]|nr:sigma-70 family RNA polymerase sigma factor [Gemmataceae bacterium]